MSCGVVPSRHIVPALSFRGLRPRLPKSYAFVVPSRHLFSTKSFVHELHELTRRQCATGMATGSVARIGTNAMRGLFTCPVAYCLPGRINAIASSRGLRPRLPSLRSVVPSRHSSSTKSFAHEFHELTRIVCNE